MIRTPLQQAILDLTDECRHTQVGEWFERYLNKNRGMGNTQALINGCQGTGATLICRTEKQANEVRAHSKIDVAVVGDPKLAINPPRSVVDNHAVMALVNENRRLAAHAEKLLAILKQKNIF